MFLSDKSTRRRLEELETRFLHLENQFKALQLDWENAYDKLLSMFHRINKRAQMLQHEMDAGAKPLSPEEEALLEPGHHAGMTAAQQAAQASVLRRRQRGNGKEG